MLHPRKLRKLKNPSMQSPGGKAISGEVIVGQGNPVFQGGNAEYARFPRENKAAAKEFCGKGGENRCQVSELLIGVGNSPNLASLLPDP
jgi:hypothetical protein